jgi:hypothetical protein
VTVEYAAGEAVIAALVRLHGEEAVPRLLQAFADPKLPSDLRGYALWQSTFQLAGFDLGAVVDEFYRGLENYATLHAERIAALPRPRVVLVRFGRTVGAMVVLDSPQLEHEGYEFVLRFRPAPDSPLGDYQRFDAMPGVPVWPGGRTVRGGRLCVQPGVEVGAEVLYEPWTCLPTSDAMDYGALPRAEAPADDGAL